MKDNPFVNTIVKFYKKHEILGFFSLFSFAMPLIPVLIFHGDESWGFPDLIVKLLPLWLLMTALGLKKVKIVPLFFLIYIIWGTIYAVLSFNGAIGVWIIYIISIIASITSAINIAFSK